MGSGLLSFPLTDFDANGDFNKHGYTKRLEWLAPYGASALFAAGGTGEFFSLTGAEYPDIIKTAVDTCRGVVPIIAGAGGPTRFAIECAQAAEKAGAHGILLLPHYLTEAGQEGLAAHVEAVCKSVNFGVIIYNRGSTRASSPRRWPSWPNAARTSWASRTASATSRPWSRSTSAWATASPTWAACPRPRSMPLPTRRWARRCTRRPSSTSSEDRDGVLRSRARATTWRRSTACSRTSSCRTSTSATACQGYAVSIVKAGAKIVGHDAGPVRPPLTDLKPDEMEDPASALIDKLGPQ